MNNPIVTTRHDSIFNARRALPVTIVGAGATGSRVFASLVELGCSQIQVIDFDKVEAHNLANQIYRDSDIGWLKTEACRNWYTHKVGLPPPNPMYFVDAKLPDKQVMLTGIVFLLVDSMAARREIFESSLRNNLDVRRVIETRMASSYGDMLAFDPFVEPECDAWLNTLVDDADAEASACGTSISVAPTASLIANLAVWEYVRFCKLYEQGQDAKAKRQRVFLDPELMTSEVTL